MYGELTQDSGRSQLRFTRTLPHPPEKVWRALTEPEHLAAWFPSSVDGERAAGATLRFQFDQQGAPVMEGEMLVYDPPKVLEYTWGTDILRFELEPEGDGCVLRLFDTLEAVSKASRDAGGWHACLDVLADHLEGKPSTLAESTRWKDVHPWYVEHFPPEASTEGPPEWHEDGDH